MRPIKFINSQAKKINEIKSSQASFRTITLAYRMISPQCVCFIMKLVQKILDTLHMKYLHFSKQKPTVSHSSEYTNLVQLHFFNYPTLCITTFIRIYPNVHNKKKILMYVLYPTINFVMMKNFSHLSFKKSLFHSIKLIFPLDKVVTKLS